MRVHHQSLLKHKTGSLLEGCRLCCFLKKEMPLVRNPNELVYKMYIEPYRNNYQADTDALNKNVVQYRGDCE